MLLERCLNTLYRSPLYNLYLGRRLPPHITSAVFDHSLSADALCYAEGSNPIKSHLEATKFGHFRTLSVMANDVSENVFGTDENHVYLITKSKQEDWRAMSKAEIAQKLVAEIKDYFK